MPFWVAIQPVIPESEREVWATQWVGAKLGTPGWRRGSWARCSDATVKRAMTIKNVSSNSIKLSKAEKAIILIGTPVLKYRDKCLFESVDVWTPSFRLNANCRSRHYKRTPGGLHASHETELRRAAPEEKTTRTATTRLDGAAAGTR